MNERHEKQSLFTNSKETSWRKWVLIGAIGLLAAGLVGWGSLKGGVAPQATVQAENGAFVLPLHQISADKAHFYRFQSGPTAVSFFVLKSSDGVIRAALDTCDTCYEAKKGYRQEGDFMVCNNCDQKFKSTQINEVSGGCNPVSLRRTIVGDNLVIAAAELHQGARYFR